MRLTDTVAKVALAKKNALSVRTSNSVNQGFFWGGGGEEDTWQTSTKTQSRSQNCR